MKKYSFDLVIPDGFVNKWIIVEAKDEKEAKRKLLAKLYKINKKFIKVHEHKREANVS